MTKEQAIGKMLEMRGVVLASFETKKWVVLDYVSSYVDVHVLEILESHGYIEVRTGHIKATTFRIKAQGYKLALQYK